MTSAVLAAGAVLAIASPATPTRADWTPPARVTRLDGSRLDSLHQLAAADGRLFLVHSRIGPRRQDDRVVAQRSRDGGASWSAELTLFRSGSRHRHVVPNLAVGARGDLVAVAWRTRGPAGSALFLRVSRDGGATWAAREVVAWRGGRQGLGVPVLVIGRGVLAVAWTDRARGDVRIRRSWDGGRSFGRVRTLARTTLSIDCDRKVLDGLVGLAAAGSRLHLAWSSAGPGGCIATRTKSRSSADRGAHWRRVREVEEHRGYGWPELAARGRTVLASVQLTGGRLLVARSRDAGRTWREHILRPADGRSLGSGDLVMATKRRAWLAYVDERYAGGDLASTRVMVRRSLDGGVGWEQAEVAAPDRRQLRQAANVVSGGTGPVVAFQSGALDGWPRDVLVARRVR